MIRKKQRTSILALPPKSARTTCYSPTCVSPSVTGGPRGVGARDYQTAIQQHLLDCPPLTDFDLDRWSERRSIGSSRKHEPLAYAGSNPPGKLKWVPVETSAWIPVSWEGSRLTLLREAEDRGCYTPSTPRRRTPRPTSRASGSGIRSPSSLSGAPMNSKTLSGRRTVDFGVKHSDTMRTSFVGTGNVELQDDKFAAHAQAAVTERERSERPVKSPSREASQKAVLKVATKGFDESLRLARKHAISLKDVKQILEDFRELDVHGKELLTLAEFEGAIRKRCNLPDSSEVPQSLVVENFNAADVDSDGKVSFEDYLLWSRQTTFVEEKEVIDPEERHLRSLAYENKLSLIQVESLLEKFKNFDENQSGIIEWPEFLQVICMLFDVKESTDISEARVRRFWKEADRSNSGQLGFDDFVAWFGTQFYSSDDLTTR